MKVKQKSIRAFEFTINNEDDETELISYIEQNIEILKSFLISINGNLTLKTKEYLENQNLNTLFEASSLHNKSSLSNNMPIKQKENIEQKCDVDEKKEDIQQAGLIHYNLPIRSGNELEFDDDIIIFKRINSGAKVIARKNAIIFGIIDGSIEANGDYIIIQNIGKGYVRFNGEEIKKESLGEKIYKVIVKNGILVYEEL